MKRWQACKIAWECLQVCMCVPELIRTLDEKEWITEWKIRLGRGLVNQAVVSILPNCLVKYTSNLFE